MSEENANKLTNAETERLALVLEECGEVIHMIGKIQRHGYDSFNPFDPQKTTNRDLLAAELGDLRYHLNLLIGEGDVYPEVIRESQRSRQGRVAPYLHHQ